MGLVGPGQGRGMCACLSFQVPAIPHSTPESRALLPGQSLSPVSESFLHLLTGVVSTCLSPVVEMGGHLTPAHVTWWAPSAQLALTIITIIVLAIVIKERLGTNGAEERDQVKGKTLGLWLCSVAHCSSNGASFHCTDPPHSGCGSGGMQLCVSWLPALGSHQKCISWNQYAQVSLTS